MYISVVPTAYSYFKWFCLYVDGPNAKRISSPAQLGDAFSQEIHHHYNTSAVYNVQINVTPESVQPKPEQLALDAASKLRIQTLLTILSHVIHFQILYVIMQLILSVLWT